VALTGHLLTVANDGFEVGLVLDTIGSRQRTSRTMGGNEMSEHPWLGHRVQIVLLVLTVSLLVGCASTESAVSAAKPFASAVPPTSGSADNSPPLGAAMPDTSRSESLDASTGGVPRLAASIAVAFDPSQSIAALFVIFANLTRHIDRSDDALSRFGWHLFDGPRP
jgi:hypothetical protein